MIALKPEHSREARHLLGWTIKDLARAAMVGTTTIRRFENDGAELRPRTLADLTAALERAGIVFSAGEPGPRAHRCADGVTLTLLDPEKAGR